MASLRERQEGTVSLVQTLVLSVKNNRLGDKIVLSLTPAIFGMLIFKAQNQPWAREEGTGQSEVRTLHSSLTKTFVLGRPGGGQRSEWGQGPGVLAVPDA